MSGPESAVPEGAGPVWVSGPGTGAGRGGLLRPALIGLGLLGAVAAILLIVLLQRQPDPAAEGSPSPSGASPSPAPTGSAASSTADPTPEPTSSAPPAIPETWTEAAVFSEAGKRYVLGDLVAWSDGLVAAGTLYEDDARGVFGPPPPRAGRVWRSTDGTDWTDATPEGTFGDVELVHLYEAADGALIVIGHAYPEVDPVSAAWETRDGETWTPVELAGIPEGAFVQQLASGARGHVASTFVGADAHALYSADGRSWEPTLDGAPLGMVAAGDEGFVASVSSDDPAEPSHRVVASADGREWFDATEPDDGSFLAAPRGGDWIGATTRIDPDDRSVSVATWGSANGLEWERLGEMALAGEDPFGLDCAEIPAVLHGLSTMTVTGTVLTFGCGEGAVVTAGGSYASLDGAEWTRLPFGGQAFAAGAAMIGDRVVIGTDARTNTSDVIGITFWVSEP
ncbi:MAG TPA: hypothetical protein VGZ51_08315 [Actinomycetota bacterium]|nr:hypothetical protein [Actinomycetota bacterium]